MKILKRKTQHAEGDIVIKLCDQDANIVHTVYAFIATKEWINESPDEHDSYMMLTQNDVDITINGKNVVLSHDKPMLPYPNNKYRFYGNPDSFNGIEPKRRVELYTYYLVLILLKGGAEKVKLEYNFGALSEGITHMDVYVTLPGVGEIQIDTTQGSAYLLLSYKYDPSYDGHMIPDQTKKNTINLQFTTRCKTF